MNVITSRTKCIGDRPRTKAVLDPSSTPTERPATPVVCPQLGAASRLAMFWLLMLPSGAAAIQHESDVCPAWCLSRATRTWACETSDCQPCLEACLDVEAHHSGSPQGAYNEHQAAAEQARSKLQQQSWTCSPKWPPQRMFVLFTSARSASTTACSVINTLPDRYCAHELLNKKLVRREDDRAHLSADPARFMQHRFEEAFADKHAAP
jgi:hypothetical protein